MRDGARKLASDERGLLRLLEASRLGSDAAAEPSGASADVSRTIAALVRVDAGYGTITRRLAQLDQEMSGLRGSMGQLDDLNRTLATTGGVRPASEGLFGEGDTLVKARAEADGVRRQIEALEQSRAPASEIAALRGKLEQIESAIRAAREAGPAPGTASGQNGPDLPGLLRSDRTQANELYAAARAARAKP